MRWVPRIQSRLGTHKENAAAEPEPSIAIVTLLQEGSYARLPFCGEGYQKAGDYKMPSRIGCNLLAEGCILDLTIGIAHLCIGLGEKRSTSVGRSFRLI